LSASTVALRCDIFEAERKVSFCERAGLIRRVPFRPEEGLAGAELSAKKTDPIWEGGEKGVLLATERHREQKLGVRSQESE